MGRKSDFDYKDGHEKKEILVVNIANSGAAIKHRELHDENYIRGSVTNPEPVHADMISIFKDEAGAGLKNFIVEYLFSTASAEHKKEWKRKLYITEAKFNYNSGNETCALKAKYIGSDKQSCILEVPAHPLYNEEIESHANNQVYTYTEHQTKLLKQLQEEAKAYLGGKRGEMQQDMFEEGDSAEAV